MSFNCDGISPKKMINRLCEGINGNRKNKRFCEDFNGNNTNNVCPLSCKETLCNQIGKFEESSTILENVLDISSTLVNIMCICGIHECKANKALDIIIYAFMHFDEVAEYPGGRKKKRIRKDDFYIDLIRDCGLTKNEAKLTYSIVKCAFKAFYYKQNVNRYEPDMIDECAWKNAANQTVSAYTKLGASRSEAEIAEKRISCVYENFISRMKTKREERNILSRTTKTKCVCDHYRGGNSDGDYFGNFKNDFDEYNPCKAAPLEPPLCGEFSCKVVCPPGSKRPQIICKDPCGRTFLKVDGTRVNFDPFLMETEARRVVRNMYPTCDADRIRILKESLNVCRPASVDTCDEKLAELCRDASLSVICDDDDEIEFSEKTEKFYGGRVSLSAEIDNSTEGYVMTITIKGYHNEYGYKPLDIAFLKILCNYDPPLEFACTRLQDKEEHTSLPKQKSNLKKNTATSIHIRLLTTMDGRVLEIEMKGYSYNNGHVPNDISFLKVQCKDLTRYYKLTPTGTRKSIKSELGRSMKSEIRDTKSEIRDTKSEIRGTKSEIRDTKGISKESIPMQETVQVIHETEIKEEEQVNEDKGTEVKEDEDTSAVVDNQNVEEATEFVANDEEEAEA